MVFCEVGRGSYPLLFPCSLNLYNNNLRSFSFAHRTMAFLVACKVYLVGTALCSGPCDEAFKAVVGCTSVHIGSNRPAALSNSFAFLFEMTSLFRHNTCASLVGHVNTSCHDSSVGLLYIDHREASWFCKSLKGFCLDYAVVDKECVDCSKKTTPVDVTYCLTEWSLASAASTFAYIAFNQSLVFQES